MFKALFEAAEDREIPFAQMWEASWPCWDWAEPSDRLENTLACNFTALQRDAVQRGAAIMDAHLKFLHQRLHAEVDFAEGLLAADPAVTFDVVTSFWQQLYCDYEKQAEEMASLLQKPVDLSEAAEEPSEQSVQRSDAVAGEEQADDRSIIAIDRHAAAKAA